MICKSICNILQMDFQYDGIYKFEFIDVFNITKHVMWSKMREQHAFLILVFGKACYEV